MLRSDLAVLTPGISSGLSAICQACAQQIADSTFMNNLNGGGGTVPGPSYTVIQTRNDEIVTPCTSAFPAGPTVTNILLQNVCPLDLTDRIGIAADTVALHLVLNALGSRPSSGRALRAARGRCRCGPGGMVRP